MITVRRCAAQGDVLVRRIDALPDGARLVEPVDGRHVVAHSETGHDHYLAALGVDRFVVDDPLVCYLRVAAHGDLEHARSYDTHESLRLLAGLWEIRRQEEWTPLGWAPVQD